MRRPVSPLWIVPVVAVLVLIAVLAGVRITRSPDDGRASAKDWVRESQIESVKGHLKTLKYGLTEADLGFASNATWKLLEQADAGTRFESRMREYRIIFDDEVGISRGDYWALRRQVNLRAAREVLTFVMSPVGETLMVGEARKTVNLSDPFSSASYLAYLLGEIAEDLSAVGMTKTRLVGELERRAREEMPALLRKAFKKENYTGENFSARTRILMFIGKFRLEPKRIGLRQEDLVLLIIRDSDRYPLDNL